MLEFNYRPCGVDRPFRHLDDGISFIVRYVPPGLVRSSTVCEKQCQTKDTALNFCVILRTLGGEPAELLQLIQGQPDAVLDGRDLEEAIERRRTRLETEAVPPWR